MSKIANQIRMRIHLTHTHKHTHPDRPAMASSDYIHFYFIRRISSGDLTDDKLLLVVVEGISGDLQVELEVGICRQLSVLKGSGRAIRAG